MHRAHDDLSGWPRRLRRYSYDEQELPAPLRLLSAEVSGPIESGQRDAIALHHERCSVLSAYSIAPLALLECAGRAQRAWSAARGQRQRPCWGKSHPVVRRPSKAVTALWPRPTWYNGRWNIGVENNSKCWYPAVATSSTVFSLNYRCLGETFGGAVQVPEPTGNVTK